MKTEISNLLKELELARGKYLFVNFVSPSYAVSREFAKDIENLFGRNSGCKVITLENYKYPIVFDYYNVSSYPYVLVFAKDGNIVRVLKEEKSKVELLSIVD